MSDREGENVLKENERIDQLMQYDLKIIQSSEVFSFSLDAVLLGHFAKLRNRDDQKVMDLCSGNGAVALMISQKTKSHVYGIEIQEELVDMARRSILLNGLEDRISMIHKDLKELSSVHYDTVDVITCNPPYFPLEEKNQVNPNKYLAIARHELYVSLDELLHTISKLLKMKGKMYIVHRPSRFLELMDVMRKYHITPKSVQFVHPNEQENANMVLVEGIKYGKEAGFKMLPPLYVHDELGNYRPKVRKILYGTE